MAVLALVVFYSSLLFFGVMSLIRVVRCVKTPIHLRWELYCKGSVFQKRTWWTQAREERLNVFPSVVRDILFTARRNYQRNKPYWFSVAAFHLGIYAMAAWHVWLFLASSVLPSLDVPLVGLYWGHTATSLALAGALGILIIRTADSKFRLYAPRSFRWKWILLVLTLAGGFYPVYAYYGNNMPDVMAYVNGQLTFDLSLKLSAPWPSSLHLLMVAGWLFYLPFGHMAQTFARYYQVLRWDYVANLKGSRVANRVARALSKPISWSAGHVGGAARWRDLPSAPVGIRSVTQ